MEENKIINETEVKEQVSAKPEEKQATDEKKEEEEVKKTPADLEIQLKKLQDELAKEKKKSDELARENKEKKNLLRSMQTEEERKAAEKAEAEEAMRARLAELEKQSAVATSSKKIMSFVDDESSATAIAEALYGAEDIDLAMDEISRAWNAREKKLRQEFGKIPAPSIGSEDAPPITKEQLMKMTYRERIDFANKYPEKYNSLTN